MIAHKIVLAVIFVSVAFVQINAKPAEVETTLATQFENALKDITLNFKEFDKKLSEQTNLVKSSVSSLFDFKFNPSTLRSMLEGKTGVSDFVKDSVKQLNENAEDYSKKFPKELTNVNKYNEIIEYGLKAIGQTATDLSKKAQGNTEAVKTLREFTVTLVENFMNQAKSIKTILYDKKA